MSCFGKSTRTFTELQKVRQTLDKSEGLPMIAGEPSEAETAASS